MKRSLIQSLLIIAASCSGVALASPANLPYDFSYSMFGASSLRPLLAFNDGFNTYIQLDERTEVLGIEGYDAMKQGAYLVVEGVPSELVLVGPDNKRMTVRYQQHLTSPAVALAHGGGHALPEFQGVGQVNDPMAACKDEALETSIIAVTFGEGGDKLSKDGEQTVLDAVGRPGVQRIVITSPNNVGRGGNMRRHDYLAGLLGRIGIPRARVNFRSGDTFEGATEIEVRSQSATGGCEPGQPYAKSDGRNLAITALDADLNSTFAAIARALNKRFVVEGNIQPTVINLQIASMPIMQALMLVGDKITTVADVVLRDDEVVLRYKSTGTWGRM